MSRTIELFEVVEIGSKHIDIPNDIQIRIGHAGRTTTIEMIPHSMKGEDFVYHAPEEDREALIAYVLDNQ